MDLFKAMSMIVSSALDVKLDDDGVSVKTPLGGVSIGGDGVNVDTPLGGASIDGDSVNVDTVVGGGSVGKDGLKVHTLVSGIDVEPKGVGAYVDTSSLAKMNTSVGNDGLKVRSSVNKDGVEVGVNLNVGFYIDEDGQMTSGVHAQAEIGLLKVASEKNTAV